MKSFTRFSFPFLLLGLWACSPMDVDQSDATIAELPADFDAKTYLEINPDVVLPVIKDAIVRYNKALVWTDAALKTPDDSAFAADTAQIFWLIENFSRSSLDTIRLDSLGFDSTGQLEYRCAVGNCANNYIKAVKELNFQQEEDDIAKYAEVLAELDSIALAEYHYRSTGRYDGHPYKYCGADKGVARNTTSQPSITYTPQKAPIYNYSAYTYCFDQADEGIYMNKEQN